jgi:hypothetical protein
MHGERLEAATLEDSNVGLAIELEALVEPSLVDVEGIRVLHDELAHADEPPARPRLVAILGLHVVPELRELLVALQLRRVKRERLLVREREDEVPAGAVLQLEELWDAVAAGLLPELCGREDRRIHLLRADRVHLFADDLLDLAMDAPAEREKCPQAGAHLAHEAPAHEELVRRRFRVGGIVAQGRKEEL